MRVTIVFWLILTPFYALSELQQQMTTAPIKNLSNECCQVRAIYCVPLYNEFGYPAGCQVEEAPFQPQCLMGGGCLAAHSSDDEVFYKFDCTTIGMENPGSCELMEPILIKDISINNGECILHNNSPSCVPKKQNEHNASE